MINRYKILDKMRNDTIDNLQEVILGVPPIQKKKSKEIIATLEKHIRGLFSRYERTLPYHVNIDQIIHNAFYFMETDFQRFIDLKISDDFSDKLLPYVREYINQYYREEYRDSVEKCRQSLQRQKVAFYVAIEHYMIDSDEHYKFLMTNIDYPNMESIDVERLGGLYANVANKFIETSKSIKEYEPGISDELRLAAGAINFLFNYRADTLDNKEYDYA